MRILSTAFDIFEIGVLFSEVLVELDPGAPVGNNQVTAMMTRMEQQKKKMNNLRNQMKTSEGQLNAYIRDLELHLNRRVATENATIVKINKKIEETKMKETTNEKRLKELKELEGSLHYVEGRLKTAEKDRNAFLQMSREEKKNKFESEQAYIAEQQKLYSKALSGGRRKRRTHKRTLRKHKRTLRKHKRRTHRR